MLAFLIGNELIALIARGVLGKSLKEVDRLKTVVKVRSRDTKLKVKSAMSKQIKKDRCRVQIDET